MSGKSRGSQTVTQQTQLPPEISQLLSLFTGELSNVMNTTGSNLTPNLSGDTLSGLNLLRSQFGPNNPGMRFINDTLSGNFLSSNPFTGVNPAAGTVNPAAGLRNKASSMVNSSAGLTNPNAGLFDQRSSAVNTATGLNPFARMVNTSQSIPNRFAGTRNTVGDNDLSGVIDAVTNAATIGVGDRFSQAGRGGSEGEGVALGREITRQLAPIAFQANEAQLGRQFAGEENRIDRLVNTENALLNRMFAGDESRINRLLSSGADQLSRQFAGNESRINRMNDFGREMFRSGERGIDRQFGAEESLINRMTQAERDRINSIYGS